MTSDSPSRVSRIMTWLVVALTVVLFVAGVALHGVSVDVHHRFWSDMFGRFGGPLTFRFFLQPTMAAIAALHDGIRDARQGHRSFFWSAVSDRTLTTGRLREGLYATSRIMLLGLSMDAIYQLKVLDTFYPAEAVVTALALAVLPYFIFRWMVERVMLWRLARDERDARRK